MQNKVVALIKGGIGNQLFCYAAARRLAFVNDCELILDDVTGFRRDLYNRRYCLDNFNISSRKANPVERKEPFARYRRYISKRLALRMPFEHRRFIVQEDTNFDARLLDVQPCGIVYLDGYWQSEGYFQDVDKIIRCDLQIKPPQDEYNQAMAKKIALCNAVSVHVRWFDPPDSQQQHHHHHHHHHHSNISLDYYSRAVQLIKMKVSAPHFFLFSDYPEVTAAKFSLSNQELTVVSHNNLESKDFADIWLMKQCKHFIIANSTFSWWGAWLSDVPEKIVIAPDVKMSGIASWGFKGLIPDTWITL